MGSKGSKSKDAVSGSNFVGGVASGPINTRRELDLIVAKKEDILESWEDTEKKVAGLRQRFQALEAEASIHGIQLHARGGPRHSVYDEMNDTSMSDNLEKLKKKAAKNRGLLEKMAEKGKSEKEGKLMATGNASPAPRRVSLVWCSYAPVVFLDFWPHGWTAVL